MLASDVFFFNAQVDLNTYLAGLKESPTGVRSLSDVIKFNDDHPELEKPDGYEGQSRYPFQDIIRLRIDCLKSFYRLIDSEATSGRDDTYSEAAALNTEYGRTRGIDAALQAHRLDALILPTTGPPWSPAGKHLCCSSRL